LLLLLLLAVAAVAVAVFAAEGMVRRWLFLFGTQRRFSSKWE